MIKKIAAISLMLAFVTGCARVPIQRAQISNDTNLETNEGLVAVEVVNNSESIGYGELNWQRLYLVRLDNLQQLKEQAQQRAVAEGREPTNVYWTPDIHALDASKMGVVDSRIFVGAVPEGTYMIKHLASYSRSYEQTVTLTMPVGAAAGTIEVSAGALADLGALVFQPLVSIKEPDFWSGTSETKAFVTPLDGSRGLEEYVSHLYPKVSQQLNRPATDGWATSPLDSMRRELGGLAADNAFASAGYRPGTNDPAMLLGRMGMLEWHAGEGQWHSARLDASRQLLCALGTDRGLYVGAERGALFAASELKGPWRLLTPVASTEAIEWMGRGRNGGYAVTSSGGDYHAYRFDQPEGDWTQIGHFGESAQGDKHFEGELLAAMDRDGRLKLFADAAAYTYQDEPGQWSKTEALRLVALTQLSSGILAGVEGSVWIGVGDQVISTDYGKSWLQIERDLKLFGDGNARVWPPSVIGGERVVTLSRSIGESGGDSDAMKLISAPITQDEQALSWRSHGRVPSGCDRVLPQISRENGIYLLCGKGSVALTRDMGQSWQTVRPIDRQAMSEQYDAVIDSIEERAPELPTQEQPSLTGDSELRSGL